ncbi:Chitin synthesis regulation Congo red resistance RCR protein [Penicillium cosmopolitanum]|uniref:Chitin synthesis regulation Congo red resistance RCR protein n=1 Tax=Penicillium cosmopolitanum TaxID=1131564 RepID=A0A9W9WAZ0_9EURO|nr:Chitin synthesis regulation Congo red resistance RCR protein [Penicillium cosmopolitanum]KAJ5414186.1 Chitin synthesis regulation Congo red resistance RCR protein [Penicillium cosmopolitanum]
MPIVPRLYSDCYGDDCYYGSNWDRWGRWVAFAVIVGCAFLLFFGFACFNARRRRSHGRRPMAGTAWMAPPPGPPPPNQPYYQQPYGGDPYAQQPPPPQYSANPAQYGYFGAAPNQGPGPHPQQNGIELQSPPNAYGQGAREYAPPEGPPPAKV